MTTILAAAALVSLVGYPIFIAIGLAHARTSRRAAVPCTEPPVSILKPCAGVDDDLAGSIASFFAQTYPETEILLGVADESDPAVAVIREVLARHPTRDARLVVTGPPPFASPKVSTLAALAAEARHDLFWLSDSNTRVRPETLRELVRALGDPSAGCAASTVVGVGERTWAAALGNLHMSTFVGAGTFTAHAVAGMAGTGKSVLLSRSRIDEVGGWRWLGEFAGEDVVLFQELRARGLRVALADSVVEDVCARASFAQVAARHLRWAAIRWRTVAFAALFEPMLSPIVPATACWLAARDARSTMIFVFAAVVQAGVDLGVTAMFRAPIAWRYAWLAWVRPWFLLALWLRALAPARIAWRGVPYRIGPRGRLTPDPAMNRVRFPRPAQTRRSAGRAV